MRPISIFIMKKLITFLSLSLILVGCIGEPKDSFPQTFKIKSPIQRGDIHIRISDATWQIFEDIQEIEPLFIEYDPTWKDGNVSKNVSAQFQYRPCDFNIGIVIYNVDISEMILAHEILHAKLIVQGHPFFYRVAFPANKIIANLENEIQHIQIYKTLSNMGFNSDSSRIKNWKKGTKIMHYEINKIPANTQQYVLNVIGASSTLGGLLRGINISEIRSRIPRIFSGGIDLGVQIFEESKKYDLTDKEEDFKFHLRVASLLKLTYQDTVVGKLDFEIRKRFYYDPLNGRLLSVR